MNTMKFMVFIVSVAMSLNCVYGNNGSRTEQTIQANYTQFASEAQSGAVVNQESDTQCERCITDDKWWIYGYRVYDESGMSDYLVKSYVYGDTIVNGLDAKILRHVIVDENYQEIVPSPLEYFPKRYVRRDDGKTVYSVKKGDFRPLLDYSLEPGEKVQLFREDRPSDIYLTAVSSRDVLLNGVWEKVLVMSSGGAFLRDNFLWISGVGSPDFNYIYRYPVSNRFKTHIIKCFKGTECIYSEDDYNMLLESGIHENSESGTSEKGQYYNLQGMPVSDPKRGELYILRSASGSRKVIF